MFLLMHRNALQNFDSQKHACFKINSKFLNIFQK